MLTIVETPFRDVKLVELPTAADERGVFSRLWSDDWNALLGFEMKSVQVSLVNNTRMHTLRGLHYQGECGEETKIVYCAQGSMYDVVVDLRKESESYGKWMSITLAASKPMALIVPPGFAHGYQTLANRTIVIYHIDQYYDSSQSYGIHWSDPTLGIDWPDSHERIISQRDRSLPQWK